MIRKRTIRRRVVSGAAALFVAARLMIAVVLVTGHGPALATRSSSSAVSGSTSAQAQTSTARSAQAQPSTARSAQAQTSTARSAQSNSSAPSVVTRSS